MKTKTLIKFLIHPPLQIHCWGGLGSQLFALAFAIEVATKSPKRQISIIAHTSGVTQRHLELKLIKLPQIEIFQIDDFISQVKGDKQSHLSISMSFLNLSRKLVKSILSTLQFLVCSDPPDRKIKPWTRQVRSHYFRRPIDGASLILLTNALCEYLSFDPNPKGNFVLHCRLGDLLTLENKLPLEASRVRKVTIEAKRIFKGIKLEVASDSPSEVEKYLPELSEALIIKESPLKTLNLLATSRVLIASTSKLSLWGVILGIAIGIERTVFIPHEMYDELCAITSSRSSTNFILY